jgi:ribonuclease P/MRP protein subunit RPP1
MISTTNIEQAKNLIKKATAKPVIVKAQNDDFNRKMLEYGRFDILLSPEAGNRRNTLRNIDSGLNNVLAEIASKNNIAIGMNIEEISNLGRKEKAERLARIIQNIKICRKAKARFKAINYNDEKNAFSLLITLGASTHQAKEAIEQDF